VVRDGGGLKRRTVRVAVGDELVVGVLDSDGGKGHVRQGKVGIEGALARRKYRAQRPLTRVVVAMVYPLGTTKGVRHGQTPLNTLALSIAESAGRMSELDTLKEKIAYLKLWLGIFVVTDISLIGWLITNYEKAKLLLLVSDIVGLFSISIAIFVLHKRIEREIERLREL